MRTVFIDVDGVLLDWLGAFLDWAYENGITHDKHGDPIRVKPEWVKEYNMPTAMMHWMHPDAVIPAILRFEGSQQWHDMRPLADIRLLEAVKNAGVGLHILSACSPKYRVDSLMRLTRHYGPVFDGCTFCEPQDKAEFISSQAHDSSFPGFWFIDDCPANLTNTWHPADSMLVTQPYNLTAQDDSFAYTRYASVNEALIRILKEVLNAE